MDQRIVARCEDRSSNARYSIHNAIAGRLRQRRRNSFDFRVALFSGAMLLLLLLLLLLLPYNIPTVAGAFCRDFPTTTARQQQQRQRQRNPFPTATRDRQQSTTSATTATALSLFRPDWMRRAGRIEEKRKAQRAMYESLLKRREELGITTTTTTTTTTTMLPKKTTPSTATLPQKYRVVCRSESNRGGNSNSSDTAAANDHTTNDIDRACDDDDVDDSSLLLEIYLFVPENEAEASDESNILDRLRHGEIVTSIQKRTVRCSRSSSSNNNNTSTERARRPADVAKILAASIIYNVDTGIDPFTPVLRGQRGGDDDDDDDHVLWIEHDKGGWSPSMVDGILRLVPLDDDNVDDASN